MRTYLSATFILALVLFWLLIYLPLLQARLIGVFFSMDPDIMYASNALAYTKIKQIFYIDHPGTLAIFFLAKSLIPLRLLVKVMTDDGFVIWTVRNLEHYYFYLRTVQSLLLTLGVGILTYSAYLHRKKVLDAVFIFSAALSYSALPYFGLVISAEATNVLIIGIWSYFYHIFANSKSPLFLSILSIMSGILLSNRLTNLFIVIGTLSLVLSLRSISMRQKIYNFFLNLFLVVAGFLSVTWIISDRYTQMFSWVLRLSTQSGLHGTGTHTVFDPATYVSSFRTLLNLESWPFMTIGVVLLIILSSLYKRFSKWHEPSYLMVTSCLIGIVVFAKYSLSHYQFPNYMVLAMTGITVFSSQKSRWVLGILSLLLIIYPFRTNIKRYHDTLLQSSSETSALEQFIADQDQPRTALWEWGTSKDFALLWGRSWSGSSYAPELLAIQPELKELVSELEFVRHGNNLETRVFDTCWDKLYIQKVSLDTFVAKHPRIYEIEYIPGTRMALLKSDHCLTKP